jgi:hypothetical protein
MTDVEVNAVKEALKTMDLQVVLSRQDYKRIYRKAVLANLTAYVILGAATLVANKYKDEIKKSVDTAADKAKEIAN